MREQPNWKYDNVTTCKRANTVLRLLQSFYPLFSVFYEPIDAVLSAVPKIIGKSCSEG